MDAGLAARRLPALADNARAEMGQGPVRPDRLPEHLLLCGAEEEGWDEVAGRHRPRNPAHLREARYPAARARSAARDREAARRTQRGRRGWRGRRLRTRG